MQLSMCILYDLILYCTACLCVFMSMDKLPCVCVCVCNTLGSEMWKVHYAHSCLCVCVRKWMYCICKWMYTKFMLLNMHICFCVGLERSAYTKWPLWGKNYDFELYLLFASWFYHKSVSIQQYLQVDVLDSCLIGKKRKYFIIHLVNTKMNKSSRILLQYRSNTVLLPVYVCALFFTVLHSSATFFSVCCVVLFSGLTLYYHLVEQNSINALLHLLGV